MVGHGVILADTEMPMRATILVWPSPSCPASAAFAGAGLTGSREAVVARADARRCAATSRSTRATASSPTGTIEHAEIITEFRRAVLMVREQRAAAGITRSATPAREGASSPFNGLVTFIVQVRLHPLNTFAKEPAYDLYVSTGPRSPPIAARGVKRDPVYALGPGSGSPLVGGAARSVAFRAPRSSAAAAPALIVTDDKAEILWQARIDLSRYR